MHLVLTLITTSAVIYGYRVTNVTVPLDSGIGVLRWSDTNSNIGSVRSGHSLERELPLESDEVRHKRILLDWEKKDQGARDPPLFPFEIPNTCIVRQIDDIASFPVLSIDYGSKFIGMSIHHFGHSEILRGILNPGNVEDLCDSIYSIVRDKIRPPTRFIILVGFPFSRDKITEGKCLFQTLYNLDFATRLARYIHRRHLEAYGNWEHIINDNKANNSYPEVKSRCFSCSVELGCCPYNNECGENFILCPSDYGSASVIGISEEHTSYQTEIFESPNNERKDSLSSDLIYRNFLEAMNSRQTHRRPFIVLPSHNNLFRSHQKGDCLLFYKTLHSKISSRLK